MRMPIIKEKTTTFLGRTNFRGSDKVFGIKLKDRRQHVYVVGKTGTGKSVLLKNMALQDIHAGRGVGIIDPHGEFVEELISQIPEERINDVIYFNPVDADYPIGFNVLEVPDLKYKHLVVSDLLGIFTKSGPMSGVRAWNTFCRIASLRYWIRPGPRFWASRASL